MTQAVYDFKKRVGDAKRVWDNRIKDLIEKGAGEGQDAL